MDCSEKVILNRLREHRKSMGYEQVQVACLLGFKSHARISKWEQGTAMPNVENLLGLSIIYRALPDDLYSDLRQELVREIGRREKLLESGRDVGG